MILVNIQPKQEPEELKGRGCVPTSIHMITEHFRRNNPNLPEFKIEKIAEILEIEMLGVALSNLSKFHDELKKYGFSMTYKTGWTLKDIESSLKEGNLVIIIYNDAVYRALLSKARNLDMDKPHHAAVPFQVCSSKNILSVNDPAFGEREDLVIAEFLKSWGAAGNAVILFEKRKQKSLKEYSTKKEDGGEQK